jgi:DNA modification methylase
MFHEIHVQKIRNTIELKNIKFRKRLSSVSNNISELKNVFGESLIRVDGEIPIDLPISNGDRFLFISYEQTRYSHGIHKYPAKFFPELPRWLIQKYSKQNDWILDPFGGSATIGIEALLNQRNSVCVDIDPFAQFIAKVKTTFLDIEELEIYTDILIRKITEYKEEKVTLRDIPCFPYRDNWFEDFIIKELAYIKKTILLLPISKELRLFFLACFSSIIRNVSNADDNCTRTVVRKILNKQIYPSMALANFVEKLLLYKSRIKEFIICYNNSVKSIISTDSDARELKFNDNYFDLAVTSPPYVNAVDYPRTHQLELYWLDLAVGSLTPLKKQQIGTESVSIDNYSKFNEIGIKIADEILYKIYKEDKRRAFIAYKFLLDMEKNLVEVYRTLKQKGKYAIVIGNNQIRGNNFESWKYLMPIAERNNFKIQTYFGSEIIKHFIKIKRDERINTDWVIILEK